MFGILLRHGADPTYTDAFSRTALHACLEKAQDGDDTEAAIRSLLENGADPNAVGGLYKTPLIAASISDEASCVKILLQSGAHLAYRSEAFGTAGEAADRYGREEIASLLLSKASARDLSTTTSSKAELRLSKNARRPETEVDAENRLVSRKQSIDQRRRLSIGCHNE